MRARIKPRRWLAFLFLIVMVAGSGPCPACYDDECSNPGEAWCDGEVASRCAEPNENGAYALLREDCAGQGLVCVSGPRSVGDDDHAACVDLRPCEAPEQYECGEVEGEEQLMRCVALEEAPWYQAEGFTALDPPNNPELALKPLDVPCADRCASDCACPEGRACLGGFCLDGAPEAPPICCGGVRASACPAGEPCETEAGAPGVCGAE